MTCSEKSIAVVAKKIPMLEKLVLSNGLITLASLVVLADHCPRLQSIDAGGCRTTRALRSTEQSLRASLKNRIKDLRLPHPQFIGYRIIVHQLQ
jgi:hypothetical protein